MIWTFYLNNSSLFHKHAVTALNEHKIAPHAFPVLQATQAGLDVIAHNQFARHLNMEYGYQMWYRKVQFDQNHPSFRLFLSPGVERPYPTAGGMGMDNQLKT